MGQTSEDLITFEPGEPEDPFDTINGALIGDGRFFDHFTTDLGEDAFGLVPFEPTSGDGFEEPPPERIHPLLAEWIATRPGEEQVPVVITFIDNVQIPRFPSLNPDEPRDSDTNLRITARSAELVRQITEAREPRYESLSGPLTDTFQATVLDRHWLICALLVDIPLSKVPELEQWDEVLYIEPRYGDEQMLRSEAQSPTATVQDARTLIGSDPYFAADLSHGWIGLLDTGVRRTHELLADRIPDEQCHDCVNGGADCRTKQPPIPLNPDDDCLDHGTATAAIICGNALQGESYRGVCGFTLDSYKVYRSSWDGNTCDGGLDHHAAPIGIGQAGKDGAFVIVAQVQAGGDGADAINFAADHAFDMGRIVVAAAGNTDTGAPSVRSPARAHKAIAVGAFDALTQQTHSQQVSGPAPDQRIKPDLQGPTNTETASTTANPPYRSLDGTSGATPYVAGAAALLRNNLRGSNHSIDPGQVYAWLILSGQQPYPFNNKTGAGHLRLPLGGTARWGKTRVDLSLPGQTPVVNVSIDVDAPGYNVFDAALWWPESAKQAHNDLNLRLIDPNGFTRAESMSESSVFERAQVLDSIDTGTWILQIRGQNVTGRRQTVYWAACFHHETEHRPAPGLPPTRSAHWITRSRSILQSL